MKKLFILITAIVILLASGCAENKAAYSQEEVYQIVDNALTQGELSNQQILASMDSRVLTASLIKWQHQPLEIIVNKADKLKVLLQGEFILTGSQTQLPLTLTQQNDQWQLDKNFCPLEQKPEDYYYGSDKLQNIINDVLYRVNNAKNTNPIYDYNSQELFQKAFLYEAALFYANNQNWNKLKQSSWQADDYQVWLNTQDKIVVIMRNGSNQYRPLNIYRMEEYWVTDETYAAQGEFAAVPAILPFSSTDIQFPVDMQITPAQFSEIYGQPISTEIGAFLIDTNFLSYNYPDFSITWLNWNNSGHYTINNIKTQTSDFWPELRGVQIGNSMADVIKRFHHCQPYEQIDLVYGLPMIYGVYEHLADYGLIDGNQLIYTSGNDIIRLTFIDDKLTSLEFQASDY